MRAINEDHPAGVLFKPVSPVQLQRTIQGVRLTVTGIACPRQRLSMMAGTRLHDAPPLDGGRLMTARYDALIIGGGHNGLVCAFYLARAGMKVRVLERRHVVGGAAVTEEFHPGFRNSTASYTVSLLAAQGDRRHEAARTRLSRDRADDLQFLPFPDTYLKLGGGMDRTQAEFARFSREGRSDLSGL